MTLGAHQVFEQTVLPGGQLNPPATAVRNSRECVELQVADTQYRRLRVATAAQERYKPRYDLRTMVAGRRVFGEPKGKILTDDFAPVETMRAIEKNNEKWKEQTEAPR